MLLNRCLRKPDVKRISNLSDATIRRLELEGKFPARRKIGKRAIGWLESEILEWLNTRTLVSQKYELNLQEGK
jgi:prophage regulatory protein